MGQSPGRDPIISFERVGKTMTAHFRPRACKVLCSLTKSEVHLILEGYPPFYRSSVRLPDGTDIGNPIREPQDIERAGWIVHLGLAQFGDRPHGLSPTANHNMELRSVGSDKQSYPWQQTSMRNAVDRFGLALDNIEKALPGLSMVLEAKKTFANVKEVLHTSSGLPDIMHPGYESSAPSFLTPLRFHDSQPGYREALRVDQWQIVMQAFTHREPLTADETALLEAHMKPVLQAAFIGLVRVLGYGESRVYFLNGSRRDQPGTPLPQMPELAGTKYVYLRSCYGDA